MNRRTFLKYLAALPLVGTAIIKAKPAPEPPSVGDAADFGADFFSAECRYPLRDVPCRLHEHDEPGGLLVFGEGFDRFVLGRDGKLVRG